MLSLVRPFVYSFPMMKVARLKKTIAVRGRGPHCRRAVHVTYSSLACLQCRSLSRVQLEAELQGLTPSVTLWIQGRRKSAFPYLLKIRAST